MKNLNYRLNPTSGAGGGVPINPINADTAPFKATSDKISSFIGSHYPPVHKRDADETVEGSLAKLQGQNVQIGTPDQAMSGLKMPK